MFRRLSFGMLLTTQGVLWTACGLAFFGTLWRTSPFEPRILLFGAAAAFLGVAELVWWNRKLPSGKPVVESVSLEEDEEIAEEELDENTTQQIVRCRTGEGTERLEGTFLVEFEPEQRTASVHVPFCPAFEGTPAVDTLLLDGDAALSVVKPRPFGVRIDVKRRDDTTPIRILVVAVG